jgi:ribulose-5-phosphate 4-epimerase/fuculose-1-phosphate aldolase
VALGQIGQTVQVLHNSAASFCDGVPVFEKVGLIRSRALGDEVAAALGQGRAMLLRGHGANVAEVDVRRATIGACFLEEAADLQLRALAAAGGRNELLRAFTAEEAGRVQDQIDAAGPVNRAWEYYVALAERRI